MTLDLKSSSRLLLVAGKWTRGFCRDKTIALQLKGYYHLLVFCDASWLTFRFYFWTADSLLSATEATLVLYRFALESFLNFSSLSTLGILPSNTQTFVTRPLGLACPESSLLRAEVCYCCYSKLLWSYQWLLQYTHHHPLSGPPLVL